ncbi:MAG: DUF692 domain-containing protein [Xanthomonadaceae bacterium]|nr:DUF692 domain-containing protein [Xanthomonadaceae bacterium]MDE1964717.1 DUF692 domain-containing protein [Xanthomonadaceae bacterium]
MSQADRRIPVPTPDPATVPSGRAGVGLRAAHLPRVLEERPDAAWFEVHSENLFAAGGAFRAAVEQVRDRYPLSLHGVGLSLGSADELSASHLARLKDVVRQYRPVLVSEHLCWGSAGGRHANDLLPLPHTRAVCDLLADRIRCVQDALGRELLVENVSSYLQFDGATMPEWEFVAEVVERAGCALLLDINNIYVNSINHGFDARTYLRAMPVHAVREFHLAGFTRKEELGAPLLIDTHDRPVAEPVWALYAAAVQRFGPVPTLIEWDQDLPALETLLGEAARAQEVLDARAA